jgi:cell division protein FtsQ
MWDNPALLRTIANVLLSFSALVVLMGSGYYWLHRPDLLPLQSVRLSAMPQRVEVNEVLRVVRSEVNGNFITVDIKHLRVALEQLPWVRSVNIRREFPDRLSVQLEEHQALARWNNTALVNVQGEVFEAVSEQELPNFVGPEGESAEVSQRYVAFGKQLKPLGLTLTQLAESPRHAWQLHLNSGWVLELGSEQMEQRLERFVTVYPYGLAGRQLKYVDLRYRNGFAVGGVNMKAS